MKLSLLPKLWLMFASALFWAMMPRTSVVLIMCNTVLLLTAYAIGRADGWAAMLRVWRDAHGRSPKP